MRRAGGGELLLVTVGRRPVAQLGPIEAAGGPEAELTGLVAGGAVVAPRRTSPWRPPPAVTVWTGTRVDRAVAEVRG